MVLDIGLIQMAGIMPTLILAQVSLGRACQDVEDKLEFAMPHTKAKYQASVARSIPNGFLSTEVHLNTVSDVAGSQSDTLQRDRQLDQSTTHCLQSKEPFTVEDDHRSHHVQYPSNKGEDNPENLVHCNKVKELDPELGLGERCQRPEMTVGC